MSWGDKVRGALSFSECQKLQVCQSGADDISHRNNEIVQLSDHSFLSPFYASDNNIVSVSVCSVRSWSIGSTK